MTDSLPPHVLITGAGRGIGAAIAEIFAKGEFSVSLLGRQLTVLEEQVAAFGSHVQAIACDITDPNQVERAFDQACNEFGPITVLVNNAGAAHAAPFLKTSPERLQAMLDVNYLGACYCIQNVLPAMIENKHGKIINIGSTSSVKGYSYVAAYSAAKHAIMGLTRSLAKELSATGVSINTVCPGFTETDIVGDAIENIMQKTGRSEEQAIAELTKHNPQARFVQPIEVAEQVYYLATQAPQSITGQALMVDGGETC